jgi:hypothetical protein
MASGVVYRANRPNTWLHRSACKREEKPCRISNLHCDLSPRCTLHPIDMSPGAQLNLPPRARQAA